MRNLFGGGQQLTVAVDVVYVWETNQTLTVTGGGKLCEFGGGDGKGGKRGQRLASQGGNQTLTSWGIKDMTSTASEHKPDWVSDPVSLLVENKLSVPSPLRCVQVKLRHTGFGLGSGQDTDSGTTGHYTWTLDWIIIQNLVQTVLLT